MRRTHNESRMLSHAVRRSAAMVRHAKAARGCARVLCAAAAVASVTAQSETLTVTSLADDGPGSLRQAVAAANASTGVADTIVFHVSGTITLASRLPDIEDELTIDGRDAAVVLSGNKAVQVLFVGPGKRASIRGLTLADGHCASPCSGGAIVNVGFLEVSESHFAGNSALLGGAIHNFGDLKVLASRFSGNSAVFGGAIHNFDRLEVVSSTFSGNSAAMGGGAIHNFDRLTVVGSVFFGNHAGQVGGCIHNVGRLHLSDNLLSDNFAAGVVDHVANEAMPAR